MDRFHQLNPFARRDSHSPAAVVTYKILTIVTWLLSVIVSVYYTLHKPHDGPYARGTIWHQNWHHPTGFTLDRTMSEVYWVTLWVLQAGYMGHLFSPNLEHLNAACAVGSHFILNNLLHFAFVMLFVRSYFGWAELMLVINFLNLSSLYFRHNAYPRFIHTPAVCGPLAWTFVAIYWNGAIMVPNPDTRLAHIFANIFVWAILVYGGFFLAVYKDYMMALCLAILSAALGVAQFERQLVALQWIFAFAIMATLFIAGLAVAVPVWTGREVRFWRGQQQPSDAERAPLLGEN